MNVYVYYKSFVGINSRWSLRRQANKLRDALRMRVPHILRISNKNMLLSSDPLQKNCSRTSETAQTQCCNARAQALLPAVVSQTLAVWVQSRASVSESGSRGLRGRVGVVSSTQTPSHGSVSCELHESNIAMGHTKSRK